MKVSLISALTFAIRPCRVDRETFKVPVIFFFIAAAFYAGTAYISGHFARWTGIVLLCIFAAYMAYTVWDGRRQARPGGEETESPEEAEKADEEKKDVPMWQSILKLVIGAACIAVGANLLVDNGTIIATEMGVPESVIALTFVALGTSLPELATAITALVKGHSALSLGNIVGANLFNLVLVSGLATTIKPFYVKDLGRNFINGTPVSLLVDIPVMLFVMAFMTLPALKRGKLTRTRGIILLAVYAAFCVFQFAYK